MVRLILALVLANAIAVTSTTAMARSRHWRPKEQEWRCSQRGRQQFRIGVTIQETAGTEREAPSPQSEVTEVTYQTPMLAQWPYRMVRLACDLCPRRRQYRKYTLIARFGGDVLMPDVRHLIAECACKDAPGAACGVYYADLRER